MSIKNNTNSLQELLSIVQSLPEAGGGGITPTGTINITENGTHNVTNYASANVNVPQLDTSDANATASDMLSGKTAYVKGSKVTGNIPTVNQPNPTVSVDSSGLITASYTPNEGYTSNTNEKEATKQLTTKGATTYTPSTNAQIITNGVYLTGAQTIKGDANLVPENIKEGVSIFDVIGTHAGGSGGADEYCNVTFSCPGVTTYIGCVNGELTSAFANGDVHNQVLSVKKGSLLTFIDESGMGFYGVSVSNGINFISKSVNGGTSKYKFFCTFEITADCTISISA